MIKNQKLYDKVKKAVMKKNPIHSAYRSGHIVKTYKKKFADKYGSKVSPYSGSKPVKRGLSRWFKEDWKSDTGKYRYTSKSSVYRPTKRITSKTPKTFSELSKDELLRAKAEKARRGRVKRFKKVSSVAVR